MTLTSKDVEKELKRLADPARAHHSQRFFKTGPGEYGEGDIFLGLTVPQTRKVASQFRQLPLFEIEKLANSDFHEFRLCALVILTEKYKKTKDSKSKEKLFTFYMKLMRKNLINNWDLIDVTAPTIGEHLTRQADSSKLLEKLAKSKNLWDRRLAVLFTFSFLRIFELQPTIRIATLLLNDDEDLIQKAVGWSLRELGKRDIQLLRKFLEKNSKSMPRTMLRYSIEKMSETERKKWLRKD